MAKTPSKPVPRILVVEDDSTFRETVRELLRDLGYKARGARSLTKAVKRLTRHHFDLILSDVEIGDGTGFDVIQIARQAHPDAPVILMSGNADPALTGEAVSSGAAQFLPKPFTMKELITVVEAMLNAAETDDPSSEESAP
ncbi:MAG TPA: response regulator [Aggregatilineales bacterium]|nr:response regulator [Anaerolineales bacterium]HRE49127.1 response regulator [Aggregatilineales bacterium]